MKYPTVEELVSRGIPEADWDWIRDDDSIIAEIRMYRYLSLAKFNFDHGRYSDSIELKTYASAGKVLSFPGDPRGLHEVEPPDDLTGLIPDPEEFISHVKLTRLVAAKKIDDLDAFNEDGRRRAIRLGFPPDSWVIKKEEIDYRTWQEMVADDFAKFGFAD
jgi:hypothetical protein